MVSTSIRSIKKSYISYYYVSNLELKKIYKWKTILLQNWFFTIEFILDLYFKNN